MENLKIGGVYRHFKGGVYEVLCAAVHTETGEELVIYRSRETKKTWARPVEMFLGEVDKEKYPDVKQKTRFELIEK